MLHVADAEGVKDLDAVRGLIREFVAWHRRTHVEDLARIDAYFDPVAFEAELSGLPGDYTAPDGRLLLARVDGAPAGCVAMHRIGADVCEMKRMFVPERYRGVGVGAALAAAIVEAARVAGYRRMQLDTSVRQVPALGLYKRLGFVEIAAPDDLPSDMQGWLLFFELTFSLSLD
jgi:putative acetyltransferase